MKNEIRLWCLKVCKRYNFQAIYFPLKDMYSIRFKGKGIQNFTSKTFYMLPKRHRESMLLPLMKVGLNLNAGEKKLNLYQQSIGKVIYK